MVLLIRIPYPRSVLAQQFTNLSGQRLKR